MEVRRNFVWSILSFYLSMIPGVGHRLSASLGNPFMLWWLRH